LGFDEQAEVEFVDSLANNFFESSLHILGMQNGADGNSVVICGCEVVFPKVGHCFAILLGIARQMASWDAGVFFVEG
jgi:hypothetical protein